MQLARPLARQRNLGVTTAIRSTVVFEFAALQRACLHLVLSFAGSLASDRLGRHPSSRRQTLRILLPSCNDLFRADHGLVLRERIDGARHPFSSGLAAGRCRLFRVLVWQLWRSAALRSRVGVPDLLENRFSPRNIRREVVVFLEIPVSVG